MWRRCVLKVSWDGLQQQAMSTGVAQIKCGKEGACCRRSAHGGGESCGGRSEELLRLQGSGGRPEQALVKGKAEVQGVEEE